MSSLAKPKVAIENCFACVGRYSNNTADVDLLPMCLKHVQVPEKTTAQVLWLSVFVGRDSVHGTK